MTRKQQSFNSIFSKRTIRIFKKLFEVFDSLKNDFINIDAESNDFFIMFLIFEINRNKNIEKNTTKFIEIKEVMSEVSGRKKEIDEAAHENQDSLCLKLSRKMNR